VGAGGRGARRVLDRIRGVGCDVCGIGKDGRSGHFYLYEVRN